MRIIIFALLFFCSNLVLSQQNELCNKLECVDDDFKKKDFVKYYTILNKTLVDARGCKDNEKLDNVLEFTRKITSVGPHERMAKFIENEFIKNPTCILSAIKRISQDARHHSLLYLVKPNKFNSKKIDIILDEYKNKYPNEIQFIVKEKKLLNKK